MQPDCDHACRQGKRCKTRTGNGEDQPWRGGGVERPNTLCHPCEAAAFTAIRKLADNWHRLHAARFDPRIRGGETGKITGTATRPLPIRAEILDLQARIDDELVRWYNRLTGGDPLPTAPGLTAVRVDVCTKTVGSRLSTLVELPLQRVTRWGLRNDGDDTGLFEELDGVDAVLRLAHLHDRTIRMLGEEQRRQILPEPCHVCGVAALSPSEDQELVTCLACTQVWHRIEFARLYGVLDDSYGTA